MISHVSFASVPATDLDRALAFWRDVVGLEVTVDSHAIPGIRWIMLRLGTSRTQLHLDHVEAVPAADHPALPLVAPDVPGTVETLRGKGVEIVMEPKPAEWDAGTTYALIRDSEGNVILIASQ
ncbi:MAG TPA: VOC family protein [Thermohalobaculum sp.]|nr:VOC family protein [Thermohalobaculum sp.]